jgi:hypothetical protein
MTRFTKSANGKYVVQGKSFDALIGTRAQVWHGTAYKTSGGLTKNDLFQNKAGRIVSKTKHHSAKKEMRLVKAGYGTKKGKFGYVKLGKGKGSKKGGMGSFSPSLESMNARSFNIAGGKKSKKSRSRKMKGGIGKLPLSPSDYDGKGVGTSGVALQFVAGNASS